MNRTIEAFGYPQNIIQEYQHWVTLLRPDQVTVGSLVLAAKSEALHLGELPAEAWAEFAKVSSDSEEMTRQAFGAEKFNYLALMMVDPNVHFHFVPRYSKPILVLGQEFQDVDWPRRTQLNDIETSAEVLAEIERRLWETRKAT